MRKTIKVAAQGSFVSKKLLREIIGVDHLGYLQEIQMLYDKDSDFKQKYEPHKKKFKIPLALAERIIVNMFKDLGYEPKVEFFFQPLSSSSES